MALPAGGTTDMDRMEYAGGAGSDETSECQTSPATFLDLLGGILEIQLRQTAKTTLTHSPGI